MCFDPALLTGDDVTMSVEKVAQEKEMVVFDPHDLISRVEKRMKKGPGPVFENAHAGSSRPSDISTSSKSPSRVVETRSLESGPLICGAKKLKLGTGAVLSLDPSVFRVGRLSLPTVDGSCEKDSEVVYDDTLSQALQVWSFLFV